MSKFRCQCGEVLHDSTDFIRNKAYWIADQDYDDFLDEMETRTGDASIGTANRYFQEIFQCPQCHSLILFRDGTRYDFQPREPETSATLLRSYRGNKWQGFIAAHYRAGKGEMYWYTNQESGFRQELTLSELQELYFSTFETLHKAGILRSSFLSVEGQFVHRFALDNG